MNICKIKHLCLGCWNELLSHLCNYIYIYIWLILHNFLCMPYFFINFSHHKVNSVYVNSYMEKYKRSTICLSNEEDTTWYMESYFLESPSIIYDAPFTTNRITNLKWYYFEVKPWHVVHSTSFEYMERMDPLK